MSPPEQKAPPAPVRMTVCTCVSSRICATAAARAGRMAWLSALRASGRFSVIVPMPSWTEVNTGEVSGDVVMVPKFDSWVRKSWNVLLAPMHTCDEAFKSACPKSGTPSKGLRRPRRLAARVSPAARMLPSRRRGGRRVATQGWSIQASSA
ncbi:hypothetical protein SDC9_206650 [bioreactor metagenome]|uniref:Uncharacterized protein n=1 Tax=bioreactor metagenome TaxID=1076179 RepID=A0A645JF24_9ZZZZ